MLSLVSEPAWPASPESFLEMQELRLPPLSHTDTELCASRSYTLASAPHQPPPHQLYSVPTQLHDSDHPDTPDWLSAFLDLRMSLDIVLCMYNVWVCICVCTQVYECMRVYASVYKCLQVYISVCKCMHYMQYMHVYASMSKLCCVCGDQRTNWDLHLVWDEVTLLFSTAHGKLAGPWASGTLLSRSPAWDYKLTLLCGFWISEIRSLCLYEKYFFSHWAIFLAAGKVFNVHCKKSRTFLSWKPCHTEWYSFSMI